jgi:spermidine dehydrogenase
MVAQVRKVALAARRGADSYNAGETVLICGGGKTLAGGKESEQLMGSGSNTDGSRAEKALDLDQDITRRDFLNSTLLASGGLLLSPVSPTQLLAQQSKPPSSLNDDWTGYGGVGDYANSNGNTTAVFEAGHRIRDGEFESSPANFAETGEVYDCVVVGGGISGLAAALLFHRQAEGRTCLLLDNHPIFGGEAKRNEFLVDGHRLIGHQGSALFQVNYPLSFIERFYRSIGLKVPRLAYQKWGSSDPEIKLPTTPYLGSAPYGLYFGAKFGQPKGVWLSDPWGKKLEGAPISTKAKEELLRYQSPDPATAQVPKYRGDAISRRLDTITLEEHLIERHRISRETVRTFLTPDEGSGFGLGPDALSAYTAYAFDTLGPFLDEENQMLPDGNSGIARLIVKTLIPEAIDGEHSLENVCRNAVNFAALDRVGAAARIRLGSTAVWVKHDSDPAKSEFVSILYERGSKLYRVRARSVVMAGGSWTTKHVVRDLPDDRKQAYAQFYRSPCMLANIAVRNWRFLYKMGISGCQWFEGLGTFLQVRKVALCGADSPTIGPDSPVILSLKVLYPNPGHTTEEQGHLGRAEMIATPFQEYERQIRQQFHDMFAHSGFDASRDIAGIILNRWGHAYASPAPGFYFGKDGKPAPGDVLRAAPFGRIAFANVDLSGMPDHKSSILEADRAVGQLLDQVLT